MEAQLTYIKLVRHGMNIAGERHRVYVQVHLHYVQTFNRFVSSLSVSHKTIAAKAFLVSIYHPVHLNRKGKN